MENTSPILSIIVPVYNVENYLRDCLDSLLAQDVDKSKYEIICVNDGSTDKSEEIIKSYAESNNNIRLITKKNGGASSARNVGIDASKGKYLWFVDGDDFIRKGCIKLLMDIMEKDSPYIIRFRYGATEEQYSFAEICKKPVSKLNRKDMVGRTSAIHVCSIIEAEPLRKFNIRYNEEMKYGEDILFMYFLYIHCKGDYWVSLDNILYFYRNRSTSAMHNKTKEDYTKQTKDLLYMCKVYSDAYNQKLNTDPEILKNTKDRQHLAIIAALTIMPRSNLNYKKTMRALKDEGLYPFPFIYWHVKNTKNKKSKVLEFMKLFFKFRPFYRIYYLLMKK